VEIRRTITATIMATTVEGMVEEEELAVLLEELEVPVVEGATKEEGGLNKVVVGAQTLDQEGTERGILVSDDGRSVLHPMGEDKMCVWGVREYIAGQGASMWGL